MLVNGILLNTSRRKGKNHAEIQTGRLVPDLFLFLKKNYARLKQVIGTLVLIYFDRTWPGHTIQANIITFQTADRYAQFWFFVKMSETSFSITFCVWFFKKSIVLYSYDCPDFIVWLLYLLRYWAVCVLCVRSVTS